MTTVHAPNPRTSSTSKVVLDVADLHVAHDQGNSSTPIVRGISFGLTTGQRLGLVGESGSGKSMTALAIMRLLREPLRVTSGSVRINGREMGAMSKAELARARLAEIAMIYQDPLSSLNPVHSIGDQIVEAIQLHTSLSRSQARARAVSLLDEVGVPDASRRVDSYPHEFSGGMRQRVMIAMAICVDPSVLIADEPTTALDVTTQAKIVDLLNDLVDEHRMAVLWITHDLGLASTFCSDVAVMYAGRIVELAGSSEFFRSPSHPYSSALLGSVPTLTRDPDLPLPAVPGQPPMLSALPAGCTFHPRCPLALEKCATSVPERYEVSAGSFAECHLLDGRDQRREG